jgi:hypothetical protein
VKFNFLDSIWQQVTNAELSTSFLTMRDRSIKGKPVKKLARSLDGMGRGWSGSKLNWESLNEL